MIVILFVGRFPEVGSHEAAQSAQTVVLHVGPDHMKYEAHVF